MAAAVVERTGEHLRQKRKTSAFHVRVLALCLGLLSSSGSWPLDWPNIQAPPGEKLVVVGDNMVFNGVPMQAFTMESAASPQSIVAFYQSLWREPAIEGAPGYLTQQLAPWTIISRMDKKFSYTVQVKPVKPRGSYSLIGITTIPQVKNLQEPARDIPKMTTTTVISDIAAVDGNKTSRTVWLQNKHGLAANMRFYEEHFAKQGWSTRNKTDVEYGQQYASLSMAKQGREMQFNFIRADDETKISIIEQ